MTELSAYAANIFDLAEKKTDKVFYNSSAEHASIVHQALVKNAANYVDMLCGDLCSDITNNSEYCNLLEEFLQKDSKHHINILFTGYSDIFNNKPIASVLKKYPFQVDIKKYDGQITYKNHPVHFTVSDDRAFRLETDIDQRMAFGNFNSPSQAGSLRNIFEKVFNSPLAKNVSLC